jgi:hypothetical protein
MEFWLTNWLFDSHLQSPEGIPLGHIGHAHAQWACPFALPQ